MIEVLVALAVGGVVVLSARALVEGVTAAVRRTVDAGAVHDADANGLRLARALVDQLDPIPPAHRVGDAGAAGGASGGQDSGPLTGDRAAVRLATWCLTPGGWAARCAATLRLEVASETTSDGAAPPNARGVGADPTVDLTADLSTGEHLVLRRGLTAASFRYLATASGGGRWATAWAQPEAPLAIAVVADADTLLLPIGPRQ